MKQAHGQIKEQEIKLRWLIFGELLTWIGASFIWPLTSVYLNKQLHISLSMIGIVLFCNCAGNIVGSVVAGRFYDKYNPYPLIVGGMSLDALILYLMAAFHGWPEYWLWLTLNGILGGWNGTMINSIATSLKKYPGRYVFNVLYFAQNLGVVTGTLIVGYLYAYSVTLLFIIAALLFTIGLVNAIFNYRPIIAFYHRRKRCSQKKGTISHVPMPRANFLMTMGFFTTLGFTWLMYMNWESNLSVYMVSLGIPFHLYSLLWTLNASEIVIMQAILARFPHIFKNLFHQIIFGIIMFSLSFVALIFAKDYAHFALAMFVLTLGESTALPAIPAYVNDLSPLSSKGKYQGLTLVAAGIGRAFGPMFGGLMIDHAGYLAFFMAAALIIFLLVVLLIPLYSRLRRQLKIF